MSDAQNNPTYSTTSKAVNARSRTAAKGSGNKQTCLTIIQQVLPAYFASTLNQVPDMAHIAMAMIQHESGFIPLRGVTLTNAHFKTMVGYPAIGNVYYNTGTAQQKANIVDCNVCLGLIQVTAYYCIRGGGPGGKCLMESARPDLLGGPLAQILINPGDDIDTTMLGQTTQQLTNQIIAGMIVLESVYKQKSAAVPPPWSSRIAYALAGYYGFGIPQRGFPTNTSYVNDVLYGATYKLANSGLNSSGGSSAASSGTVTTNPTPNQSATAAAAPSPSPASGNNQTNPGC